MAATKRKAEDKAPSTKKRADTTDDRATKRQRKEAVSRTAKQSTTAPDESTEKKNLPKVSILQQDERAFPRGGAGVLTPLEHKQIQLQATKDVLFEELGQKRTRDASDTEGHDVEADNSTPQKPGKQQRKSKAQTTSSSVEKTEANIRVDGLKFKRLVPGSTVLGQVTRITSQDVTLDLPNNLTGTAPIIGICAILTNKLEALADAEEEENKSKIAASQEEDVDLRSYFRIGQYLRAAVVSTSDDLSSKDVSKTRKRIELSLDPRLANRGIAKSDVCVNCMLQASVSSVEDHGLIMDLGIPESNVSGFLPKKEIPQEFDYPTLKEGTVFMCLVTKFESNGKVARLSANHKHAGDLTKSVVLLKAPTMNTCLPGTAVDLLISQVSSSSIAGKIMGMVNASADIVHSGAGSRITDIDSKYKVGSKIKVRIIFALGDADTNTLGVSLLDHILSLSPRSTSNSKLSTKPTDTLPLSSVVEQAKVLNIEPSLGVFVDVGVKGVPGFVHISRLSDGRVDFLPQGTGAYRSGTSHRARIVGYNALDGLFLASFEQSVMEQPYLRIEDIPVGKVVKAKVEKIIINAAGVGGVLVNLAQGISGLVPEIHMADVHLQHPERKFKEGISVTARVLSTDLEKRQIRLTLKKSLVNSDADTWNSYNGILPGSQSLGTILNINPQGALVQFFGNVRAFLPIREMSDAYIQDPSKHFRVGQVVNVHALTVDAAGCRMTVSCRIPSATDAAQAAAFARLKIGDLVGGTVSGQSAEDVTIDLKNSSIRSTLRLGHLTDGSDEKVASATKRVKIGQVLQDLVVLELFEKKRSVIVTHKPSLVRAAKANTLLCRFEDVVDGKQVDGYVRNITPDAVFVQFAGDITGLLHKSQISDEMGRLPNFGLSKDRSVTCTVLSNDSTQQRFTLSTRNVLQGRNNQAQPTPVQIPLEQAIVNSVDGNCHSIADFTIGKLTTAQITAIKDTQLNVKLADNVQGRIDVSEVFSSWKDIKDRKNPLRSFHVSSLLPVKVLGMHDARNHRFLPISHRNGKVPVYELSAKVGEEQSLLSLDQVETGKWYTGFVNGFSDMCLWVNLSPNVRGRVERMQISEDVSVLNDLEVNFPIGSVLRVRVTGIDLTNNRLDLSAKTSSSQHPLTFDDISPGMIVTGRITKVTERAILVQLSGTVSGLVGLTELADDFSGSNPMIHNKNDIVRVCIIDIDKANKRVTLSTRPSKVLSSSLPTKDPSFSSAAHLKINDVVRGFIKNVTDVGIFVTLSYNVTAFVRVSELSDAFVKDWKSSYEIDRMVMGKIIAVDPSSKHVQLSLKPSVVSKDYVPMLTFGDLSVGQVVTGKIRKVEEFGAFIVVDNSYNVSGLCHRSEIAEQRVEDVRKLYTAGDSVKALVLKVEPEKRRVAFGLKASYFENMSDEANDDRSASGVSEANITYPSDGDDVAEPDGGVGLQTEQLAEFVSGDDKVLNDESIEVNAAAKNAQEGLDVGGFDWSGALQLHGNGAVTDSAAELEREAPIKKKRRADIKIDETGDLDKLGPRSASDFERLLLGQRDSSILWIQYMAFQLQLSDLEEARKVAERALREINMREQEEKMNVWVAYFNLESAYGNDDTIEEIFKRACEVNDAQQMYERLTSIYIQSAKHQKADDLFQTMIKRKSFTPDPRLWLNYATFLFDSLSHPDRGRDLLDRAMKSVPPHLHRDLVTNFAQLEFKCKNGNPERGRTVFEKLHDTYPRRWDLWDIHVDLEKRQGALDNVRQLYERMTSMGMKKRRAKSVFKKWLEFEEVQGVGKTIDHVKAKAAEYVWKHEAQGSE